ncbi:hypothetical protein ABTZ93_20405 [Streptomyces sp. NPDC097941]
MWEQLLDRYGCTDLRTQSTQPRATAASAAYDHLRQSAGRAAGGLPGA